MKIVLMEKKKGTFIKQPGVSTRHLYEAMNFETEQAARRFCREYNISGHVIVAKFITHALADVILGDSDD